MATSVACSLEGQRRARARPSRPWNPWPTPGSSRMRELSRGDRGLDGAVSTDVGGYSLGALQVLTDDGEVVAAREHAAADGPCHVAGTDDRDFHAVPARASRPRILWSAAGRLRGRGFPVRAREGIVQAHARADLELGEHLLQVPLDSTGAKEQPGADLRIGKTVAREAGDLLLLRRELVARLHRALAHPPARRHELAAGTLGKRLHTDRVEHLVGGAQLHARIRTPTLPAQPLAVEQARAGELGTQPRSTQSIDRFGVGLLGRLAFAEQRPRTPRSPAPSRWRWRPRSRRVARVRMGRGRHSRS